MISPKRFPVCFFAFVCLAALMSFCSARPCGAMEVREQRRYVFVDGGAHYGETYMDFQKTALYARYPWEIYAIEANPYLIDGLPAAPRLTVIEKAIWTEEGTATFHVVVEDDKVGSLLGDWRADKALAKKEITVETFDFGEWLKTNFSVDDYIIVSFDIEGAEMAIVPKILEDGSIAYIDRFYCELHANTPQEKEARQRLIRRLQELPMEFQPLSGEDVIRDGGLWRDSLEGEER